MAVAKRPWTSRSRDCHQRVSRIEMRRTDVDSSTENPPPRKKRHTNVLISHSHWPYEESLGLLLRVRSWDSEKLSSLLKFTTMSEHRFYHAPAWASDRPMPG